MEFPEIVREVERVAREAQEELRRLRGQLIGSVPEDLGCRLQFAFTGAIETAQSQLDSLRWLALHVGDAWPEAEADAPTPTETACTP